MLATVPAALRSPRLAGLIQRLCALGVAALVILGTLSAGRSYLWCSMMEQPVEACCCAAERAETGAEATPELRNGCCEKHHAEALLKGHVPATLEVPASLPAAPLPAPPVLAAPVPAPSLSYAPPSCLRRAGFIRAGPWAPSDLCVRLQVFRC